MKINHEFLITAINPGIKVDNKEISDLVKELACKAHVWISEPDSVLYVTIKGINEGKTTSFDLESYQKIKDSLECAMASYIMEGRKRKDDGSYGKFTIKLENYSKDIGFSSRSKFPDRYQLRNIGIKCTIDYEGDFEGGEVMKDLHKALKDIYEPKLPEINLPEDKQE